MYWGSDWLWGLPVIVITITLHICVLVLIERILIRELMQRERHGGYAITHPHFQCALFGAGLDFCIPLATDSYL